jgi:hypothetical protein
MVRAIVGAAVAAGGAVGASTTAVWSRCSVTRSSTAVVPLTETARTVSVSAGFVVRQGRQTTSASVLVLRSIYIDIRSIFDHGPSRLAIEIKRKDHLFLD